MDRGDLARMLAAPSAHECCDEQMAPTMPANGCVNLATDDLKIVGAPIFIIAVPALDSVLVVQVPSAAESLLVATQPSPRPPAVPPRIFLHSFLI